MKKCKFSRRIINNSMKHLKPGGITLEDYTEDCPVHWLENLQVILSCSVRSEPVRNGCQRLLLRKWVKSIRPGRRMLPSLLRELFQVWQLVLLFALLKWLRFKCKHRPEMKVKPLNKVLENVYNICGRLEDSSMVMCRACVINCPSIQHTFWFMN